MSAPGQTARIPFWRNTKVLRVGAQVVAAGAVILIFYVLWFNLTNNMRRAGISTDFDFLSQPSGVDIAGSPISSRAAIRRTLLVGVKNTLALAVIGVPLLAILGVIVGVARLSSNWLVAKAATVYVEVLRNIPPLLIIFFAFNAVILQLPPIREGYTPFGWFVVSNLFIAVPGLSAGANLAVFLGVLGTGLVVAAFVWWWRTRVSERTGKPHHRALWAGGVFLLFAVVGYLILDRPFTISVPRLEGRRISGGFSALGSFMAVMVALVLYTASHVAEIVRGSIQAVPKGQTEAAEALALRSFQRLRFVVLPQAFRIAVPPMINQFLNFVKNTSLALAVGYAEITRIVRQTIGNGQPAPQLILLLMLAYLAFSIVISLVANVVNRRLQLVER